MNSFTDKQKQLKEQAVQEAIYEATLKVLSRQHSDGLKMKVVAETAGIATGTLYNYFKNKVELLTFVDNRLHVEILDKLKIVTESQVSPREKLRAFVREIFAFFESFHIVFDVADKFGIKEKISNSDKMDRLGQARRHIAGILTEGVTDGSFRPVQTDFLAKHFLSAIIGVIEIQSWLQTYDMAGQVDDLTDFFLSTLTIPQA
jgi:AcrR family transcriptional regulator